MTGPKTWTACGFVEPNDGSMPCQRCEGAGTTPDHLREGGDGPTCSRCLGDGKDPDLIRWHRSAARRTVIVTSERSCPDCHGGEHSECATCLGSGFAVVV